MKRSGRYNITDLYTVCSCVFTIPGVIEDVTNVFEQPRVRQHLLADDMQGIKQSKPFNVCDVSAGLGACVTSVNNWCASRHLQLNTKKTEVMWSATNLRKISSANKDILVGSDVKSPSPVVRDLGLFFHS